MRVWIHTYKTHFWHFGNFKYLIHFSCLIWYKLISQGCAITTTVFFYGQRLCLLMSQVPSHQLHQLNLLMVQLKWLKFMWITNCLLLWRKISMVFLKYEFIPFSSWQVFHCLGCIDLHFPNYLFIFVKRQLFILSEF